MKIELLKVNAINIATIAGAHSLENFSKLASIALCISGVTYNVVKIIAERKKKRR